MSRQTKLTEELQERIVERIRRGHTFGVSCKKAGISEATGRGWLARGRGTSGRKSAEPYISFAHAVESALADSEHNCIEALLELGYTGWPTTTTKITIKPDGTRIEETTTTVVRPWQVLAWFAERTWPQRYGRSRMLEQEAMKALLEANMVPEELVESLVEGGENYQEFVRERWRSLYNKGNGNGNGDGNGGGDAHELLTPPDLDLAMTALVQHGIIPRQIRLQISRAEESDRATLARQLIGEWLNSQLEDEEDDTE